MIIIVSVIGLLIIALYEDNGYCHHGEREK